MDCRRLLYTIPSPEHSLSDRQLVLSMHIYDIRALQKTVTPWIYRDCTSG